jgi:low affinity Fe/Cu permease
VPRASPAVPPIRTRANAPRATACTRLQYGAHMKWLFNKFAQRASQAVGSPYAFIAAIALLIGWLASGPAFHYSDTWQLIINTSTTIITFLMVFLIQNSQNRDATGLHLKLDELIRATKGARNSMIDLAKLSDAQLRSLEDEYKRLCSLGDRVADALEQRNSQ